MLKEGKVVRVEQAVALGAKAVREAVPEDRAVREAALEARVAKEVWEREARVALVVALAEEPAELAARAASVDKVVSVDKVASVARVDSAVAVDRGVREDFRGGEAAGFNSVALAE